MFASGACGASVRCGARRTIKNVQAGEAPVAVRHRGEEPALAFSLGNRTVNTVSILSCGEGSHRERSQTWVVQVPAIARVTCGVWWIFRTVLTIAEHCMLHLPIGAPGE
jgi:hypothetical protein